MSGVAEKGRGSFCSVLRQLFDRVGQQADQATGTRLDACGSLPSC